MIQFYGSSACFCGAVNLLQCIYNILSNPTELNGWDGSFKKLATLKLLENTPYELKYVFIDIIYLIVNPANLAFLQFYIIKNVDLTICFPAP